MFFSLFRFAFRSSPVRHQGPFRPSTWSSYNRMWKDSMAFLVVTGLSPVQVNHFTLLSYMEYLVSNNLSPSNISNNLAGIRAHFVLHNLDTAPFRYEQLALFHKSLKLSTFKPMSRMDRMKGRRSALKLAA